MMISRNLCWALACSCLLANTIAARQLPQPERRTNGGIRGEKSAQLDGGIRELKMDKGPCGMDTCGPSTTPSSPPTAEPTVSPAPSQSPSDQPSQVPSPSPSSAPSPAPSTSPAPSSNPSAHPSSTPSSTPTLAPSVSAAPSPQIWDLQTIDGYSNSTCIILPPQLTNSRTVLSSLDYEYSMYLKDEVVNDEAQTMATSLEPNLHLALAREALICDYYSNLDPEFFIVGLSAANDGTVSGSCPRTSDNPDHSCWGVTGTIQVKVYYLPENRRLVDDAVLIAKYVEIVEAAFATLVDGVSLFGMELQGFSNVNVIGTTIYTGSDADDPNSNGVEGPNNPSDSNDGPKFGPAIIGLAGAAFVVLVGLLAWQGRRRREAYLKYMEEVDGLSLEESVKEAIGRRDFVVQEDDDDSLEETFQKIRNEEEENHDFRNCRAATCRICSVRAPQPIFIATELDSLEADVRAESGQIYSSRGRGSVNDTIML